MADPGKEDRPGDLMLLPRLGEVEVSSPRKPLVPPAANRCRCNVDLLDILVVSPESSRRLIDFSVGLCRLSRMPSLLSLLLALLLESRLPLTSAVLTDSREEDRDLVTFVSPGILSPLPPVLGVPMREGRGKVLVFLGVTMPPRDESLEAFLRSVVVAVVGVALFLFSEESCRVLDSLVFFMPVWGLFLGIVPYGDCIVFFLLSVVGLGFCMAESLLFWVCDEALFLSLDEGVTSLLAGMAKPDGFIILDVELDDLTLDGLVGVLVAGLGTSLESSSKLPSSSDLSSEESYPPLAWECVVSAAIRNCEVRFRDSSKPSSHVSNLSRLVNLSTVDRYAGSVGTGETD